MAQLHWALISVEIVKCWFKTYFFHVWHVVLLVCICPDCLPRSQLRGWIRSIKTIWKISFSWHWRWHSSRGGSVCQNITGDLCDEHCLITELISGIISDITWYLINSIISLQLFTSSWETVQSESNVECNCSNLVQTSKCLQIVFSLDMNHCFKCLYVSSFTWWSF